MHVAWHASISGKHDTGTPIACRLRGKIGLIASNANKRAGEPRGPRSLVLDKVLGNPLIVGTFEENTLFAEQSTDILGMILILKEQPSSLWLRITEMTLSCRVDSSCGVDERS